MVKFMVLFGILFGSNVNAQQKALMRIVSAKTYQDSIFIEYEITNKSDRPFTYYRPKVSDVELRLINMWLVDSTKKAISKYMVPSSLDLDLLTVNKSLCNDILPGDSLSLKLTVPTQKFFGKASLQKGRCKFVLSIYFNETPIKCSDCNYHLLDEFLNAAKEIELQ